MRLNLYFNLSISGAAVLLVSCASMAPQGPQPATRASQMANQAADLAMYRPATYRNVAKAGPALIVLPGEVRSSNVQPAQRPISNNIADYAELELSKANFEVLERSNLAPFTREIQLAYEMGNPDEASRILEKGGLKSTRWMVRFDVLKFEPVAEAQKGFHATRLIRTDQSAKVWLVGMRYTILDANTTVQVASGYAEQKMELGQSSSSLLGVSSSQSGQVTLDTMVQRLTQNLVAEIDAKHK